MAKTSTQTIVSVLQTMLIAQNGVTQQEKPMFITKVRIATVKYRLKTSGKSLKIYKILIFLL